MRGAREAIRIPPGARLLLPIGLWLAVLVLGLRFLLFVGDVAVQPSHGFAAYFTSSRLLREGADASLFYSSDWFRRQTERYVPGASDIYNVNLPTTSFLLLPLAGLDPDVARVVWTGFNVAVLAATTGALIHLLGLRGLYAPGFLCLVLSYQPLLANFRYGQAYVFLLGLLVIGWYAYRRQQSWLLGGSLALMLMLKSAGLLFWLLLLFQRNWRALAWATGATLGLLLFSFPWLGVASWGAYLGQLPAFAGEPSLSVPAYQTSLSFIRHMLSPDEFWNPNPLWSAPWLAEWLPWIAFFLTAGICVYVARNSRDHDLVFSSFAAASLILSPLSLDYHYVLLLLTIGILLSRARASPLHRSQLILGLSVLLVAADLPYRSPDLTAGGLALLAYPKLYGACLMLGLGCAPALRRR